MKCTS